jgi:hypothetical protein
MNIPVLPIFKYGYVISWPVFIAINLLLFRSVAGDFSFSRQTLSQSVFLYTRRRQIYLFRISFIVKSLLDLTFWYYTINYFHLGIYTGISIIWLISVICFASLCFFTEDKYKLQHYIAIYSCVTLFLITKTGIALITGDKWFIWFTLLSAIFQCFISYFTLIKRTTNVYVQSIVLLFDYGWILWLVYKIM